MTAVTLPIDDTYEDVKKLIRHIVNSFCSRYGGDVEDLVSESHLVFMKVYREFDHTRGNFTSLLGTAIENRMKDLLFFNTRRRAFSLDVERPTDSGTTTSWASMIPDRPDCTFNFTEFTETLSKDAVVVLSLILDNSSAITTMAEGKGGTPRNWRSSVREYLESLNWHANRIAETFSEIQEVLYS